MINKDYELLHRMERRIIREEPLDPEKNILIFESMVEFAKEIGLFPPKNPLQRLEEKIEFVKNIQSVSRAHIKNSR